MHRLQPALKTKACPDVLRVLHVLRNAPRKQFDQGVGQHKPCLCGIVVSPPSTLSNTKPDTCAHGSVHRSLRGRPPVSVDRHSHQWHPVVSRGVRHEARARDTQIQV